MRNCAAHCPRDLERLLSPKEMKIHMLPVVTWDNTSDLCANTQGKVMARSRIILMDRLAVWMTACVFVCTRVVVPTCSCHCRHLHYCHFARDANPLNFDQCVCHYASPGGFSNINLKPDSDWMVYSDPVGIHYHSLQDYRVRPV